MFRDLSYALRTLRRAPSYAAICAITLALGIGLATGIGSVADSVLVRDLPYRDAASLATIVERSDRGNSRGPSYPTFQDYRVSVGGPIEGVAFMRGGQMNLRAPDGVDRLVVWAVTPGFFGLMGTPQDLAVLYGGWLLLAWLAFGLALMMGAIAEMAPVVERVVAALTYVLVPLSGTFYMVGWLPPAYRGYVLKLPFIHPIEMIRGGYLGAGVQTFYSVPYVALWAAGFTFIGLLLLRFVRDRIEIE